MHGAKFLECVRWRNNQNCIINSQHTSVHYPRSAGVVVEIPSPVPSPISVSLCVLGSFRTSPNSFTPAPNSLFYSLTTSLSTYKPCCLLSCPAHTPDCSSGLIRLGLLHVVPIQIFLRLFPFPSLFVFNSFSSLFATDYSKSSLYIYYTVTQLVSLLPGTNEATRKAALPNIARVIKLNYKPTQGSQGKVLRQKIIQ